METKIRETKNEARFPEVSQAFREIGSDVVYVRIHDFDGAAAYGTVPQKGEIYAINLDSGELRRWPKPNCDLIQLLQPVGGVMEFEPVN